MAEGDTNLTNLVLSGDLTVDDDTLVSGDLTITGTLTAPTQVFGPVADVELTADGAITIQNSVVFLNKGSALVATLGTPTTAQNGTTISIVAITAQAHTVTATTIGFNAGDAASDLATFGGAIGDGLTIVAHAGEWYVLNSINITLS